jgi:nucleoside-diphosphate-sugar epimerase
MSGLYLITGGAGFIGSNMCRRLLSTGNKVRILDNLATGRLQNLEDVKSSIDFIEGDIRKPADVAGALKGVRYVIHMAALPSVIRSVEDPVASNDVNVNGSLNLLMAARDANVERFVFSTSSSVYGDTAVLPKREDMMPCPLSPYALQKLTIEHYCRIFHMLYGVPTVCLRYFNVFGPRQNPKSQYAAVIPLFIDATKNGKSPVIYGDGEQTRDFTFVEDVVDANLCACHAAVDDCAGRVFNVARGDRISVNRVASTIAQILNSTVKPVYEAARPGEVRDSQADSGLAKKFLKWAPKVDFSSGLRRTCEYYLPAGA